MYEGFTRKKDQRNKMKVDTEEDYDAIHNSENRKLKNEACITLDAKQTLNSECILSVSLQWLQFET